MVLQRTSFHVKYGAIPTDTARNKKMVTNDKVTYASDRKKLKLNYVRPPSCAVPLVRIFLA